MRMQWIPAPATQAPAQLWLMLPGAYMKPSDFIDAGFADAVHRRGLPHDIALLEANIAEVADGSALAWLQGYLLSDTRAAAASRICLLGISLGAHLAMAFLARASAGTPEAAAAARVSAACLLAPYLGPRDIVAEVAAAGMPQRWLPAQSVQSDIDRRIWQWLGQEAGGHDLHLGYGSEDRFAKAHALMAQALPASRVDVQPGGHEWPVWTALWNRHLDHVYVEH
jgi:dienelactone hydrolase